MKSKWLILTLILVVLTAPVFTTAQDDEAVCSLVTLFNGWARASVQGAPNSAAFGLLVNLSAEADTLVSASTAAAEAVELHEMVMGAGDVMMMRPVEGGFVVPAGSYLELKPGGLHIMLINLKQPLQAGDLLDLTLTFQNAGDVQLAIPIRDMAAMEAGTGTEMQTGMAMTKEADSDTAMSDAGMVWPEACAGMHVVGGWARAAVPGMPNSAAYALLLNLTAQDDVLVGVSTGVAGVAELHEMVMGAGDVMMMRPIEGGIPVPAGAAVLLQPGGLHMMLIGLTGELAAGESLDITLTFAGSDPLALTLPIREAMEMTMGEG